MKFTSTYFNFKTGKPDHIISGSATGEHTDEEIVAGIRTYIDGICPAEDRVDENGNDTLKIRKGVFFPNYVGSFIPVSATMRYS